MVEITSTSNQRVKELIKLKDNQKRKKQNAFLIEGLREIRLALKEDYTFLEIICCEDILTDESRQTKIEIIQKHSTIDVLQVSKHVYERIGLKKNGEGLILKAKPKTFTLNDIDVLKEKNLIAFENIEKPGNLGAVTRTVNAVGIRSIILINTSIDIYNPNVIRSSLGTIFSTKIIHCSIDECIQWASKNEYSLTGTSAHNSTDIYQYSFPKRNMIFFGSEAHGLSTPLLSKTDANLKIPMFGNASSLNLSVSCAIVLYESLRQSLKP